MSALLKSVWRGVLLPLVHTPRTPRSLTTTVGDNSPRSPDAIMTQLKAAPSVSDVLAAVQIHLPVMTYQHHLHALRCLFQLHKTDEFSNPHNIIKDPTFSQLCQNLKKHIRKLDANEAIEAIKVLSYLEVPVDSLIIQTLLQLIRYKINSLSIRQIMFTDFLLSRFDTSNHLVDALKLALPLAFQIHLPLEIDNEDLPLLKDMLSYSSAYNLPDRCINNVVTGLLLHDQDITAPIAKSIIWSLCQINCTEEVYPTRVQLLHICYDILTQNINQLSYDDVLRTAAKIKGRVLEKHPEYYHEQVMDAIANYVVKNKVEFEKGLLIARVLSRIAHTHIGIVEYLCGLAFKEPKTISFARTNILFGFINCLSNNNYTPPQEQWNFLREKISSNPVLNGTSSTLPWTKFCLELASLGHFEDKLLKRVFSPDYLEKYLSKEHHNMLEYLQLFTLHEAVKTFYSQDYKLPDEILEKAKQMYPIHALTAHLEACLVRGLGSPEYVLKNVVLPNGIVSDLLVVLKNGLPLSQTRPDPGSERTPFEHVNTPHGSIVVCIMNFNQGCFSLNSSRLRGTFRLILDILEKQGFAAVSINITEWLAAPSHEKVPYLMREIGYKCGEIGMKLHVS